MAARRTRRFPAPSCSLCERTLDEVGGRRITWCTQAAVIVRSHQDPIGNLPQPVLLVPLPKPHAGALLMWPPNKSALDRALTQWIDRLRPWICQACSGRTCERCGSPTMAPHGSDTLHDDGRVGHFALLPGPTGCIREGCPG